MHADQVGGWYFWVYLGKAGQWYGLAKQEPFVNGHPLFEPGEVWFEFGETYDAALDAIKKSVLH